MVQTAVLVVLDSLRFDIFEEYLETSDGFLSSMATDGMHHFGATASAPWSLPSHASMFTGVYPREHGALQTDHMIRPEQKTLLDNLNSSGVQTGCFTGNPFVDPDYGFDGWDRHRNNYSQSVYPDALAPKAEGNGLSEIWDGIRQMVNADKPFKSFVNGAYRKLRTSPAIVDDGGRRMTQNAKKWMGTNSQEDLFLFLNYMDTHDFHKRLTRFGRLRNLIEIQKLRELNEVAGGGGIHSLGNISLTDKEIQYFKEVVRDELCYVESLIEDIRDELDRQDRLQDALFIVCADHGDALGERGFVSHLAGVTEPLIRVPLLINGREVPKKEVTQRSSLNWIYHTISNYFNGDYKTDLRKVSSYPGSVGAENTGRLRDIIPQSGTKVPQKYYESRMAVFDAEYPNEKFVRIGQQYKNRTIEPRTLFESEGTECDGEIVDEFIKSLSVVDPVSRRMKKSTEDRLKDLGYLD